MIVDLTEDERKFLQALVEDHIAKVLLTHSIEKRFTLDPNAPVPVAFRALWESVLKKLVQR